MTIGPQLAETVRQDGPTAWTIQLRSGLKFSNGEPLDAAAVKFSIERMQNADLKSPIRGWWTGFKTIEVADARTLKDQHERAGPAVSARMTLLAPVPPKYVRDAGDSAFARKPVGSGPYRLADWKRDDAVVLEVNPNYAGPKPGIDRVVFRVVPEELYAGRRLADRGGRRNRGHLADPGRRARIEPRRTRRGRRQHPCDGGPIRQRRAARGPAEVPGCRRIRYRS